MDERQISELLIGMGLNPSYRGYRSLVHVLWLASTDTDYLFQPIKKLYAETAACYRISADSIQHSIRTLLEAFWSMEKSAEYFYNVTNYPVNGPLSPKEFIAVLADYLRRNME